MQTHTAFILFYQCKHQSFEWTTRWKSPNPDGILNKGMPFRETMVPEGAVIVMSQLVRFYTWLSVVISRKIKEYNEQVWEVSGGGAKVHVHSFFLSFFLSSLVYIHVCLWVCRPEGLIFPTSADDPNSGPHVCMPGTSPTEPCLWLSRACVHVTTARFKKI